MRNWPSTFLIEISRHHWPTTQENKNHNGNHNGHNGHNGSVISDLDTLTRKQPPKTLPKPKVKPVPPPKPKKSFAAAGAGNSNGGNMDEDGSTAPLISFHDEGFDGSEV